MEALTQASYGGQNNNTYYLIKQMEYWRVNVGCICPSRAGRCSCNTYSRAMKVATASNPALLSDASSRASSSMMTTSCSWPCSCCSSSKAVSGSSRYLHEFAGEAYHLGKPCRMTLKKQGPPHSNWVWHALTWPHLEQWLAPEMAILHCHMTCIPHFVNASFKDRVAALPCSLATGSSRTAMRGTWSASCCARHSTMALPWALCSPTLKKWRT